MTAVFPPRAEKTLTKRHGFMWNESELVFLILYVSIF